MDDLGIEFEPAALYTQEKNKVTEPLQQTSTKITHLIIFVGNIPDFLWPDVFFAAIYIKNKCFTKFLMACHFIKSLKANLPQYTTYRL